ncbi:hypothetical protein WHR41_09649 [Cladosporium halotolerans]|uniref:Uncharacterized protein n=1 Tax=Cladosporium halotolerans TaxID=1052096 RepID=A0AB34K9T1_9PEZI
MQNLVAALKPRKAPSSFKLQLHSESTKCAIKPSHSFKSNSTSAMAEAGSAQPHLDLTSERSYGGDLDKLSAFIEEAQALSERGYDTLQKITTQIQDEKGNLTSTRLRNIAKVSRVLQNQVCGLLLFE